jgi:tripeptide aminopeptidase
MTTTCIERFLRYVTFDTQSDEASTAYPSTEKQLVLLRHLKDELSALGLEAVTMDSYGYVTATLPANTTKDPATIPVIGFVAHVDTSPEMSGAGVKPIVHRDYQGGDIQLPDDPSAILKVAEHPDLAACVGHDIITASGTTLLGADDKAGVAEIMAAMEYLLAHPEIPHGTLKVAFTPDEEVGRGTQHFDVEAFGARYAYTLDGGPAGELESETFAADTFVATFQGFNTHPGYAKGKMVNAIKVAADFIARLPQGKLSPETTDGYEGYVHPYTLDASVEKTTVRVLVRDFQVAGLEEKEALLERLAQEAVAEHPGASVETQVQESYRNMKEVIDQHPEILDVARQAIEEAGMTVRSVPIRGGTDGSKLSFMGLPTPNLFAGEHAIHSRLEWASAWEMEKAVEVIVGIARLWEARA